MHTYSNAWVKPSLGHAEKDSGNNQAVIVLHNACQGHDHAPGNHNSRQPSARPNFLENQVARDLKGRIGKKEDGQAPVVLVGCQIQVLCKALDLGISDTSAFGSMSGRAKREP